MMKPRAPRAIRRSDTLAALTARDLDALELLAWSGVLATRHFSPFVYPSRRVAQRRLRALLDLGLVRARSHALHKDTVFVLSAAGLAELDESRDLEHLRPASFPRAQKLEHCLVIRDVFVAFLLHARRVGQVVDDIVFESSDALPGLREVGLVPDLLVHLGGTGIPAVLVEVDLGHERRRVLEDKLSRYDRYLAASSSRLLFVARTPRRAAALTTRFGAMTDRVHVVMIPEIAEGVAACSRGVFVRGIRAERTGRLGQPMNLTAIPATATGAFRVVGRSVRRAVTGGGA